jgi:hypothetical protein
MLSPYNTCPCSTLTCGGGFAVHFSIVKRCKRGDHRDAERFLARDQIRRKNAPGALGVAHSYGPGELIDGYGQFHASIEHFVGELRRDFYSAGTAVVAERGVANVGPTLEEDAAFAFFAHDVQAAFEADKVLPRFVSLFREAEQRFGPLARAAHQFLPRQWRVADSTLHIKADHVKFRAISEQNTKALERFGHGVEFRTARAADRDFNLVHVQTATVYRKSKSVFATRL